jgi:cellulose biosynthesis protein BcsQ
MHIVTFYSYKGGVGRTMALVNAAVELARRGRKVLIVDFDLEAPGIATYTPLCALHDSPGIVEYVTEYIETGRAPRAAGFIRECKVGASRVWIMPAGQRNDKYSLRLQSIDWQSLYKFQSGYLMFEDLKKQWEGSDNKFDYVLIDSRTGHTDVGGICTRHLPDAVVLMFFPNDQNLAGLEIVANEIRSEPQAAREREIILHFCASNVPDLDDEQHILARKLQDASGRLGYVDQPAIIHHYNSLSLLEQSIFIEERPGSKLATEYRSLVSNIVSRNLEDRDGALTALSGLREKLRAKSNESFPVGQMLSTIRQFHGLDGEINYSLAGIYSILGDLEDEYASLTVAIEKGAAPLGARRRRATISRLQGRQEDAVADLTVILRSPKVSGSDFVAAARLLRETDGDWISIIEGSPPLHTIDRESRFEVAEILMSERRGVALAERLLAEAIPKEGQAKEYPEINERVLALIGLRKFSDAMKVIGDSRDHLLVSNKVESVFNYAMAEWGHARTGPEDLMRLTIELCEQDEYRDINRYQCLAMANYVVGNVPAAEAALTRARHELTRVRSRKFSCWRYLYCNQAQMTQDLDELERMLKGESVQPAVFRAEPETLPTATRSDERAQV